MKDKILNIIMLFVILMLLWKGCQLKNENENLLTQVSGYQLGEKEFKSKLLKDSSTIATQTQNMLSQEEAIRLGLLKMQGEIKKVQSQVSQRQDVVVTNVDVPYIPKNYVDTSGWYAKLNSGVVSQEVIDSLKNNSVLVNTEFKKEDKWYSFEGSVQKQGIVVDSMKFNNESTITIGYKKKGFLGLKNEPIVEIHNTNPYLSVSKMNNVVIQKKKGIFQSKLFWMGLGILGGVYLHSKM